MPLTYQWLTKDRANWNWNDLDLIISLSTWTIWSKKQNCLPTSFLFPVDKLLCGHHTTVVVPIVIHSVWHSPGLMLWFIGSLKNPKPRCHVHNQWRHDHHFVFGNHLTWAMKKRDPGCLLGICRGMKYYPVTWGLFHKPWNKDPIRIPIKRPGFNGMEGRFFFVAHLTTLVSDKLLSSPAMSFSQHVFFV